MFDYFENDYEIPVLHQGLLNALLKDSPHHLHFFRDWISTVNFELMDPATFQLLPLLYKRFQDQKEYNPHHGRMKGAYRYQLFKNSLLFSKGFRIFKKFQAAKIDFILFKGAALVLKYYKNMALRAMSDIDFLVHRKDIARAEKILYEEGMRYQYPIERRVNFDEHSFDYIDQQRNCYDLHWYALSESMQEGIDQEIWQRAETVNWEGMQFKIMSPPDLILVACINGMRDAENMKYEWLLDVIEIIKSEPQLAWKTLYQEGRKRRLTEKLLAALQLVHQFAPERLTRFILNQYLQCDKEGRKRIHASLIAEGRTHGLKPRKHFFISFFDKKRKRILERAKGPKHIRYFLDEDQHINLLYLHYEYLERLKEIVEVLNPFYFTQLIEAAPCRGEGYLKVEPGTLKLKENHATLHYHATIQLSAADQKIILAPGKRKKIKLTIGFLDSPVWVKYNTAKIKYGVSYHLLSESGELLNWHACPRTYFLNPRKNYLVFRDTGEFEEELELLAPLQPGHYKLQLDLLHEGITWYSEKGNQFPSIQLTVVAAEDLH